MLRMDGLVPDDSLEPVAIQEGVRYVKDYVLATAADINRLRLCFCHP